MRDLPPTSDLLDLAHRVSAEDLSPPERERHAHLAATARTIAAREAAAGEGWQQEIEQELAGFYGTRASRPQKRGPEARGPNTSLLARLAADLRNGAFETTPSRERAARAILWRLVLAKLREANPQFLAANGFANGTD
ncbi:MAG TPA: DUF6285 domain-containing protein [Stellaceae bacterium]|jgi:hypothetical protein|nr:DUF6285 domain-containing protein [Stellaceae bacterium]